jgi:uncharacterized small protein (DUF1192 family)
MTSSSKVNEMEKKVATLQADIEREKQENEKMKSDMLNKPKLALEAKNKLTALENRVKALPLVLQKIEELYDELDKLRAEKSKAPAKNEDKT